jgi:hypothetical protein
MDEPQDVLKHYVSTGVPGLDHILKGGFLVFHPSEVELGETTRQILAEVERTKPKHVVFDGLSELWLLAADALRYRRRLLSLKHLADTVLLLRYFEVDAQIRQAISVFKKRTGSHERTLRELLINDNGVEVGEPLHGFRGILTGVPHYEGKTRPLPDEERTHV